MDLGLLRYKKDSIVLFFTLKNKDENTTGISYLGRFVL